jgi:hypothetical protein
MTRSGERDEATLPEGTGDRQDSTTPDACLRRNHEQRKNGDA